MNQINLFSQNIEKNEMKNKTTFVDNMKLPIHRWYRYSAGYSSEWVKKVIGDLNLKEKSLILDPFAGSGTTLLSAQEKGVVSFGFEKHYFVKKIAEIKSNWHLIDEKKYIEKIQKIIFISENDLKEPLLLTNKLLSKCYSYPSMQKLEALKRNYKNLKSKEDKNIDDLLWLTITSILRSTSDAGTAQWQYVLPNKRKKNVKEPFEAFLEKGLQIVSDIQFAKKQYKMSKSFVLDFDARNSHPDLVNLVDLVVTSPPYPNNYDYADATRLELYFWDEISKWSDLQSKIRTNLMHSCSQHTASEKLELHKILSDKSLLPIYDEIKEVCEKLAEVRLTKGGRKSYHTMIAAYYLDIAKTFISMRKMMKTDSTMCWVIGDSAPYGVYAPADEWMMKLALHVGFKDAYFEKVRDRNTKWKNRKHDVLLKEGLLWIKG